MTEERARALFEERLVSPAAALAAIRPGDHVVIFTPRSAIPRIEKLLTVKLEFFG